MKVSARVIGDGLARTEALLAEARRRAVARAAARLAAEREQRRRTAAAAAMPTETPPARTP